MRKLTTFILIVLMANFSNGTVHIITQTGFQFLPSNITVNIGDTIKWIWTAGVHTTTATEVPVGALSWDSPLNSENKVYEYIAVVPGIYKYVCTPHETMGMTGKFTVNTTSSVKTIPQILEVYPNPATDRLNLLLSCTSNCTLFAMDMLGNQYFIKNISPDDTKISISIMNLHSGMYIIGIKDNNKFFLFRQKIQIQRGAYK